MKRLYRSNSNKVIAGVIGGIGEYFNVDPTILRLVYILVTILTGLAPAVIGYVIATLVVPKNPNTHAWEAKSASYSEKPKAESKEEKKEDKKEAPVPEQSSVRGSSNGEKEEVKTEPLDI